MEGATAEAKQSSNELPVTAIVVGVTVGIVALVLTLIGVFLWYETL